MNNGFKLALFMLLMLNAAGLQAAPIHDAAAAGDLETLRSLLDADPTLLESGNMHGFTPLHAACFNGQVTVAHYLIDQGADIMSRDNNRFTPLHWAAYSTNADVVALLLDKGVDVNVQGTNGISPLHRAAQRGSVHVVEILIAHDADINIQEKFTGPVKPNDISGTVLQIAVNFCANDDLAVLLVENGANLGAKDEQGNTGLHLAAMRGSARLAGLLIEHGADIEAVNDHERTALYYAAKHGFRSVFDVLAAAGAKQTSIVDINFGKAPQLTRDLKNGEAYIWHLDYEFAVKTRNHLLVFTLTNITRDTPEAGLANGYLNARELAGQNITMFLRHRDRFHMGADDFRALAELVPGVDVVTSFEPDFSQLESTAIPNYRLASPNESFTIDGVTVHTIAATGGGMGYLVEADGVKVFHAGLHVSDNQPENLEKYRKEIDFLRPFGPVDITVLAAYGHNNRVRAAYEPYLYLIDQLEPEAIYLFAANNPETFPRCAEVLKERDVPVVFPEVDKAIGERFHFVSGRKPE
jgi:ankyrin repeat protein